jgi:uncharacterized membrane protein
MLVIIALGPGLFGFQVHESRWQHIFFEFLCHQDPERSYSIAGVSMAVCSRSLGIYSAFALGIIGSPLFERVLSISKMTRLRIVIGAIAINTIDFLGNAIGFWVNSLDSRFILGTLFGLSIAILINQEFFKSNIISEDTYGTEFTA